MSDESRYILVWLVRGTRGTRLTDPLTGMYVSGHRQVTTGVMFVDQSYATFVPGIPCFPHCPPPFLRLERVATVPRLSLVEVGITVRL